ncbi:RHS repeat-associated core domain-containing protein, partial [Nitrosomonas sp.]|uniref:RHS repeat-associated core domain-containing protein n=1 Tax=Nitrosomonas sp. TaxID=42353 RepID=UPI0028476C2B
AHRLTDITDSLGNTIRYTLDAAGNRTKEEIFDASNTLAQSRQQEFDALSRLWKMVGAQNQVTELVYDANGNLKQTIDPLLHTATRQFDALDRLIQANDPLGGQTLQTHDALDQITQVTDPKGVATSYTTNAFGDITQEVSQDRGTTTYTYDLAGNQLTKTEARSVVQTTAYDALNRPISQSYSTVSGIPQTGTITWTYDTGSYGIGRLAQMSDESGSMSYTYDVHGRLLNKTQTTHLYRDRFIHMIDYNYDANGRLTRITYPSGTQIDYAYGTDGRPVELRINGEILMQNIVYRPFGEPESWNWGNGQTYSRSFDLDGRLTQHLLGADTQTLTYDAASRIVNTTHTNPVYNLTYEYDANDRLIRQTDSTTTRLWDYDANSNRILEQSGAAVYPYTLAANSNRLLSVVGPVAKTYSYDAAGNALSDGMLRFSWNAAGRISGVSSGSEAEVYYVYNGHGERTLKWRYQNRDAAATIFVFDTNGRLIGDYRKSDNIRIKAWYLNQETVWVGDIPVAVIKQASPTDPIQFYMIHSDHLNTPRAIVDSSGTPVWLWRNQNAFGDNAPNEDLDGDSNLFTYNLRFAGQYFDAETNLHYNYFRDYSPQIGRYWSSDPIGLAGGLNTYGYALQNPLSYIDPTGEVVPQLLLWGVGVALTLGDMMAPIKPHPVYPDAIESVVTLPGPLGKIGSSKRLCEVSGNATNGLNGVPLETFNGGIKRRVLQSDTNAFRFSGGISDPKGRFLTTRQTLRKIDSPQDAQRVLNLPEGATASTLHKFVIPKGAEVFVGRVKGGASQATQIFIKDPGILK